MRLNELREMVQSAMDRSQVVEEKLIILEEELGVYNHFSITVEVQELYCDLIDALDEIDDLRYFEDDILGEIEEIKMSLYNARDNILNDVDDYINDVALRIDEMKEEV